MGRPARVRRPRRGAAVHAAGGAGQAPDQPPQPAAEDLPAVQFRRPGAAAGPGRAHRRRRPPAVGARAAGAGGGRNRRRRRRRRGATAERADPRPGPSVPAEAAPLIDALRFTPPAELREYNAQVWLDTSDDLKRWDTAGATELNWLVSRDAQTLANDKLEFTPRRFRYARLRWQSGVPLQFAGIVAEQLLQSEAPPYRDQLRLQPAPGRQADELVYAAPLAVPAGQVGLDFGAQTVVLPVTLGGYRELPPRQLGQAGSWLFEPVASATFYRIVQNGQVRASGELDIEPRHAAQWAARGQGIGGLRPVLRLAWEPATLVFLASGAPPYSLAVGRDKAVAAARALGQVAPGFSAAEVQTLETASAGPAQQRHAGADAAADDALAQAGAAARQRLWVLWGVLLLGVAVLGLMVWRLVKPAASKVEAADSKPSAG
ncbi:DUF3999 family protein [Rugamonas sp. DEMB1]|uniref:DUF3999 family protein n=1 Tax=Rugamonas sp. DEMB1 TaxID=3039386 RepID=UPI00244AB88E|nr:DUF3999 family protein [Rugamonas sp. DEMB1]WGG53606.1 DUF3999 family protein [Rugamonas sp. DEMB1]